MDKLQEIKAREAKATPGPWDNENGYMICGVNDGSHKDWKPPKRIKSGECAFCGNGDPIAIVQKNGKTFHVHKYAKDDRYSDAWHNIASASTYDDITGNYDYEEGGVCSTKEDSDFIAHAREDIPWMIAEIERMRDKINRWRTGGMLIEELDPEVEP